MIELDRGDSRGVTAVRPRLAALNGFLRTEAGGAVVLLTATVAALILANSVWGDAYDAFWATEVSIQWGSSYVLGMDLAHWVNDGLMTFFFLLIGLEVRREFDMGEFRERRRVAAPVMAAMGGMILPVLIWEQFAVANDRHFAAVLALILLSMAMAVLVLQMNLSRSRRLAP